MASARYPLSLKIDISTQTGLRPCEIQGEFGLEARDIHPDQNTITARIHKECDARPPINITPELTARLQAHIAKHNLQPQDRLFEGDSRQYGKSFRLLKHRLAFKLKDGTIRTIRLYDLRHAYCTRQLKRTQNTEIVRQMMGHKQLNTTQKYLHLLGFGNTDWIVEGTDDKERAKKLLKEDFQYQLTTPDGTMLFRKPK